MEPTETAAQPGQPTAPTPTTTSPQEAVAQLQQLFATLVPPERLELQDALGNRYTARGVLPARSQIVVMQQLSRLWELDLPVPRSTEVAGVVGFIVGLAADAQVLEAICEAFQAAHPAVVAQAQKAAAEAGQPHTHPADLFPVEELVAGLLPFFIRFAARAAALVGQVTSPAA